MSRLLTVALCLVSPLAAAAQQFPASPPPAAPILPARFPPFKEAVLPNGLHLILVEDHRQPVVSISLALPAGGVYDPPGKEGLSEMLAGLLTKGAGERSADEISAAIEGVGGSLNAGAGPDFLSVQADALAADAPLAFQLMGDVVLRPSIEAAELELLRRQTFSSLQAELAEPASIADRFFSRELFGRHPYGRSASPASVAAVTRADLESFRAARFTPGGSLLVIAGDLTLADAQRLATSAFGAWKGTKATETPFHAPLPRTASSIVLVHRPGSVQSNIVIGNLTFGPTDTTVYAATLATRILGGGTDSRLFSTVREQKGWTYDVSTDLNRPRGPGSFRASAAVRTEVTDSALTEILRQMRRIGAEPVTATELTGAKSALVGSFPLSIQTANQVASAVARTRLLGLSSTYLQTYRTRLAAVTAARLRLAARRTIRPDAAVIVVVGDATQLYRRLKAIAPVHLVDPEGNSLSIEALSQKPSHVALDPNQIVARRDSFVVMIQGKPLGWQVAAITRQGDSVRYREETQIGTLIQQTTEVQMTAGAEMVETHQTGKARGQDTRIDLKYSGGRVKGDAVVAGPKGPQSFTVDTTVPAGVLDDNSIQGLLPAFPWAPKAKWTLEVFGSGENRVKTLQLSVLGTEQVTVPAGTFEVYRAQLSGADQAVNFLITTALPHRIVKIQIVGAPIEFVAPQ
jgi:zinc protease